MCDRCKARGERYRRVAAGDGTIVEIREALNALELEATSGVPLGELVTIGKGRNEVRVCPRCTPAPGEPEVPLIERFPNMSRRQRRTLRLR